MTKIFRACLFSLIVFAACSRAASADDLDLIASSATPPEEMGKAYMRLTDADFSTIAPKLARLLGNPHLYLSGIGPQAALPWHEKNPEARVAFTLSKLWSYHLSRANPRGQYLDLLLSIMENADNGAGRLVPIQEIRSCLRDMRDYSIQHPVGLDDALKRMTILAKDPKAPQDMRGLLISILYEYANPNEWLDAAVEYAEAQPTAVQRGETFRFFTPGATARLTPENKKRYVREGFALLEKMDDGKGGGYFLAMHLGGIAGVKPVGQENSAFTPDRSLAKYKDEHGLAPAYFQETVDNARAWWAAHKSEYEDGPR